MMYFCILHILQIETNQFSPYLMCHYQVNLNTVLLKGKEATSFSWTYEYGHD